MTNQEFTALIQTPEYRFLWDNEHLGKENLMFLTLGGSHAYGTNTPTSDVDVRGCAINSRSDILGLTTFEQVEEQATDTVVYGFNKFVRLLIACNPNCIELLGGRPEHYIYFHPLGRELVDNKRLFLSQRAIQSFGGYANQQLTRLSNILNREQSNQTEQEEHILSSCKRALASFNDRYSELPEGAVTLYIDYSEKTDMDKEIFMDVRINHYPLRDYKGMWAELLDIVKNYKVLNSRNRKKDEAHVAKHMMHLIRLYFTCLDILENEEIVTYREKEHDLLMSIRNGDYLSADGHHVTREFDDLMNSLAERMDYAKKNTSLPRTPDIKAITEFMERVNLAAINK